MKRFIGGANTEDEGFKPLNNVPREALGYFKNKNDTAYIQVLKDRIVYNEYECKDNRKNYKNKIRTVISEDANNFNILPQTVVMCETIDDNCGFAYDIYSDTWTSDKTTKNKNIQDQQWTRTNFRLSKAATYILVIGDTGVGKSSLIQLLTHCRDIAKSSSGTMNTSFYGLLEKDLCFIDTRGREDSDEKRTDKEIINDIQSKMHDFDGSVGKIVWIVDASRRKNAHLRAELSFIKELGEEEKKESKRLSIWDSVLMIVSKARPMTSLSEQIEGTEELAREYNCPSDHWKVGINLIGFTNLDWLPENKDTEKKKKKLKSLVENNLINFIKPYEILCLKYKCKHCGIIGNPTFVKQLRCHKKMEKYHPQVARNIKYTHNGQLYSVHSMKLEKYHTQNLVTHRHPGKIESKHKSASVFSTCGKWTIGGVAVVAGGVAAVGGAYVGTVAAAAVAAAGGFTNTIGKGLTYIGYDNCGSYPCCGGNLNSKGCFRYYSCCNQKVGRTRGCVARNKRDQYYPCCRKKGAGSAGCKERYSCCSKAEGSVGCVEKCNRCNQGITSNTQGCGFEMQCCGYKGSVAERNDARNGCKERCNECHKTWGEPISPNDNYWPIHGQNRPNREQGCSHDGRHEMIRIE